LRRQDVPHEHHVALGFEQQPLRAFVVAHLKCAESEAAGFLSGSITGGALFGDGHFSASSGT
jgi:hypothetical protein